MKSACILLFNDTLYIFFFQLALENCDRVDENLLTWSRLNIVLEFFGTQVIWFRFSHITAEVLCYTFALGRLELFLVVLFTSTFWTSELNVLVFGSFIAFPYCHWSIAFQLFALLFISTFWSGKPIVALFVKQFLIWTVAG